MERHSPSAVPVPGFLGTRGPLWTPSSPTKLPHHDDASPEELVNRYGRLTYSLTKEVFAAEDMDPPRSRRPRSPPPPPLATDPPYFPPRSLLQVHILGSRRDAGEGGHGWSGGSSGLDGLGDVSAADAFDYTRDSAQPPPPRPESAAYDYTHPPPTGRSEGGSRGDPRRGVSFLEDASLLGGARPRVPATYDDVRNDRSFTGQSTGYMDDPVRDRASFGGPTSYDALQGSGAAAAAAEEARRTPADDDDGDDGGGGGDGDILRDGDWVQLTKAPSPAAPSPAAMAATARRRSLAASSTLPSTPFLSARKSRITPLSVLAKSPSTYGRRGSPYKPPSTVRPRNNFAPVFSPASIPRSSSMSRPSIMHPSPGTRSRSRTSLFGHSSSAPQETRFSPYHMTL